MPGPDLMITHVGSVPLQYPYPVTPLAVPVPSLWARILAFLAHPLGVTMAAPVVTASFAKSSYNPGDEMVINVSATGSNSSPVTISVPLTVTDAAGKVSGTATATTSVSMPNPLAAAEGDESGREWTQGTPAQAGQSFTTTFSATA